MTPVISLHGVGKRYRRIEDEAVSLRSVLPFSGRSDRELWALRDIDLEVDAGEIVGVVGRNGAGKTTLLRLLAGVTRPTEGHVEVRGRIATLIALGVGFHQEMSGRENVIVNAMLLGLTARQVRERFDSIVEFAELADFIDTPLKFYSSGMFMRLGFAVVVHVDPRVLLVDEILAVGDSVFQRKCFERLRQLRAEGAAIVIVSHSLHTIRDVCPRALLLAHGKIRHDGDVERAIAMHFGAMSARGGAADGDGASPIAVLDCRLVGDAGADHHANYDESLELRAVVRFGQPVADLDCVLVLRTDTGQVVFERRLPMGDRLSSVTPDDVCEVATSFRARVGGGNYGVSLRFEAAGLELVETEPVLLFVAGTPGSVGVIDLRAEISVDAPDRIDTWTGALDT